MKVVVLSTDGRVLLTGDQNMLNLTPVCKDLGISRATLTCMEKKRTLEDSLEYYIKKSKTRTVALK
ncbi:hypothetical protein LG59_1546 [Serratia ureilytica]|nr:hypothetical protein LG59_1546 [Serratia ureilytica]